MSAGAGGTTSTHTDPTGRGSPMIEQVPVTLQIRDSQRAPTPAVVDCERLTPGQRAGRGAARVALCWGAALLAVFIPLLHFILVPALLLAGPVAGYFALRSTVTLSSPQLRCPKCVNLTHSAGATGWPARLICEHCGTTFLATPAR